MPVEFNSMNHQQYAMIEVAALSNFRDSNAKYWHENFKVLLWKGISREMILTSSLDSNLAIKGRLTNIDDKILIIAEQIEFLN